MGREGLDGAVEIELALQGVTPGDFDGKGVDFPAEPGAGALLVIGDDGAGKPARSYVAVIGFVAAAVEFAAHKKVGVLAAMIDKTGLGEDGAQVPFVVDHPVDAANWEDRRRGSR